LRSWVRLAQDQEPSFKKFAIVALVIMAIIIVIVAVWEFALRDYLSSTNGGTEYKIDIWQGDQRIGDVTMSELETLQTVSYEDTLGSGAIDEGPLLRDVILLRIGEISLTNGTLVLIKSDLTGEEITISWGEISNTSKSYILDFTNRGTTKFTSPETEKKDRVRDVTLIKVGV
jgi:hypothetical protein